MEEVLVDTDILSYYFKAEERVVKSVEDYLRQFDQLNISIITYYEVFGGLTYRGSSRQLENFELFRFNNNIIHISEESAEISGRIFADLRKRGITIGTSDLLIAGVAIQNELVLSTNNEKHYEHISGLKLVNWSK